MDLGDFFPDNFKAEFASRSIDIGTVLRLSVKDTKPPKIKRFIVVGKTIDGLTLASVFINSEINFKVNWYSELQLLQIPLKKENREYLDTDSFVDCSKIFPKNISEISEIIKNNPLSVIGKLDTDDLTLIIDTLRNATTIKGKDKKKYGLYN